jgi:DNA-binding CsgD family transcriptional regulator
MALSNAEKQRRHRQRVKAKLQNLEAVQPSLEQYIALFTATGRVLATLGEEWLPRIGADARGVLINATQSWLDMVDSNSEICPRDADLRDKVLAAKRRLEAGGENGVISPTRFSPVAFTPRERDVIARLREGKSNKLIAGELGISEGTVKIFVRRIMKKLAAENRTQVALAPRDV